MSIGSRIPVALRRHLNRDRCTVSALLLNDDRLHDVLEVVVIGSQGAQALLIVVRDLRGHLDLVVLFVMECPPCHTLQYLVTVVAYALEHYWLLYRYHLVVVQIMDECFSNL